MPSHPLLSQPLVPFPLAEPQSHGTRPSASWPLGGVGKSGEKATGTTEEPSSPCPPRSPSLQSRLSTSFLLGDGGGGQWEASGIGARGLCACRREQLTGISHFARVRLGRPFVMATPCAQLPKPAPSAGGEALSPCPRISLSFYRVCSSKHILDLSPSLSSLPLCWSIISH